MSKWKEVEIQEIGEIVSGGTPSTSIDKYWLDGTIPFVTPYDLSRIKTAFIDKTARNITEEGLKSSSANLLPAGSIIISSRAPIGYVAVGKKDFVTNQGCKSIKLFNDQHSLFHYYNFLFNVDRIKQLGEGTTFAEISKAYLEKIKINVHTDFEDQKKIASILSSVDNVIEKTQQAIAKYKCIKQGILNDLFTRGIDANGKLRPPAQDAPELYKPSALGLIPKEWEVEIFGSKIDLVHGHQFRNYDFTDFGIPVIKIGQIKPNELDLIDCSFIAKERLPEFPNEIIRNGDVLMALTGATLGKACLVKDLKDVVLQNYRVGRFETYDLNEINKTFLYYSLTTPELLNQVFNKVNSGAQGNIGKGDFEKALFRKPLLQEQILIAEKLLSIDNKIYLENLYLEKQGSIKQGLMADLLTGKKEVKLNEKMMSEKELIAR